MVIYYAMAKENGILHQAGEYAVSSYCTVIGNVVRACDEDLFDIVLLIEPGVLHLSNRKHPDDEANIFAVPLYESILSLIGFSRSGMFFSHPLLPFRLRIISQSEINSKPAFTLAIFDNNADFPCKEISYLHYLQNIILFNTNIQLTFDPNKQVFIWKKQ